MKMTRRTPARLAPLLALLLLAPLGLWSCTDAGDEPAGPTGQVTEYNPETDYPGASIAIDPSTTTQAPGDTFTAVATYRDANGLPISGAPLAMGAEIGCFSTPANPSYTDGSGKASFEVSVVDGCPEGSYRLAVYTSVAEPLSGPNTISYFGVKVVEGAETISAPSAPTGNTTFSSGTAQTFNASGAESTLDHAIQYQFSWGDGTAASSWIDADSAGQASTGHIFATWTCIVNGSGVTETNTFQITLKARCAEDTDIVSAISEPLTVTVSQYCP